jgi:hypothetical protein
LVSVHPAGFGLGGSAVTTGCGGVGSGSTEGVATIGTVVAVDGALADAMGSIAEGWAFGAAEGGTRTTLGASAAGSLHPA